jgi:hypothetical protein
MVPPASSPYGMNRIARQNPNTQLWMIFAYDLHDGRRTAGHDTHADGWEDLLLLPQQSATVLPGKERLCP